MFINSSKKSRKFLDCSKLKPQILIKNICDFTLNYFFQIPTISYEGHSIKLNFPISRKMAEI